VYTTPGPGARARRARGRRPQRERAVSASIDLVLSPTAVRGAHLVPSPNGAAEGSRRSRRGRLASRSDVESRPRSECRRPDAPRARKQDAEPRAQSKTDGRAKAGRSTADTDPRTAPPARASTKTRPSTPSRSSTRSETACASLARRAEYRPGNTPTSPPRPARPRRARDEAPRGAAMPAAPRVDRSMAPSPCAQSSPIAGVGIAPCGTGCSAVIGGVNPNRRASQWRASSITS
jgi:hypothetical protein